MIQEYHLNHLLVLGCHIPHNHDHLYLLYVYINDIKIGEILRFVDLDTSEYMDARFSYLLEIVHVSTKKPSIHHYGYKEFILKTANSTYNVLVYSK